MKQLLIVVDYQKDFVDGALGFEGAADLDGAIANRITHYRAMGHDVVFTADTHGAEYDQTHEGRHLPVPHCIAGTDGWAMYGETGLLQTEQDLVFRKPTFGSLSLANWLSGRDYEVVELCGLVSNICVLSNAVMVRAALPNAEIVVDGQLTRSFDPVLHEKTLDVLQGLFVTVINR